MTESERSIAIIGCGFIGRAWAIVFARSGHRVRLFDAVEGAAGHALAAIDTSLTDLKQAGLVDDPIAVRLRIQSCTDLAATLDGAFFAQESVWEQRDLKAEVFAQMDEVAAPDAILASSSSAIPASEFTAGLKGRARCLVAHPGNPPYLLPVVELVPTPWTSRETLEAAHRLYESVGQVPVRLNKEIAGFVMNRMQAGVICEAMNLVAEGIMSPEDIDKVMRHSLGLRWSFMGPFETMDLNAPNGVQDYAERYRMSYVKLGGELGVAKPWSPAAIKAVLDERTAKIPRQHLAERREWRDRRLMALRQHIQQSDRNFGK
ncbi:MAG: 3-hydroxyacyl-CoA dehydrogenase [Dongiaceae bacterium]